MTDMEGEVVVLDFSNEVLTEEKYRDLKRLLKSTYPKVIIMELAVDYENP